MKVAIEAAGLTRILPGDPPVTLVDEASFGVPAGRFAVITGPSGCGKSSLLYLLGLLDTPTAGSLKIEGEEMAGLAGNARAALRLERFGFIFQFHFLLPELNALDNVILPGRRLGRLAPEECRDRGRMLLDGLGLADKADRLPSRLSGGERQRVAIARALINDPAILLADEPTGSLDSLNSSRVIDTLQHLARDYERTVLCVTHDIGIAARAEYRIEMQDGRVLRAGMT